mmetsp:Transcript_80722/g.159936  ORF Transcript_80722/g.159936 Transcript_80722/m.159936 type:complete len:223 (-) Transcript_80722:96-764(-)
MLQGSVSVLEASLLHDGSPTLGMMPKAGAAQVIVAPRTAPGNCASPRALVASVPRAFSILAHCVALLAADRLRLPSSRSMSIQPIHHKEVQVCIRRDVAWPFHNTLQHSIVKPEGHDATARLRLEHGHVFIFPAAPIGYMLEGTALVGSEFDRSTDVPPLRQRFMAHFLDVLITGQHKWWDALAATRASDGPLFAAGVFELDPVNGTRSSNPHTLDTAGFFL